MEGNRGGRRLNVAESHTTSSLTRWWPRIVIEGNRLWAWHGSMWRKHMVPWTKHGSPKWWSYSDYSVAYVMEFYGQLTLTKVYSANKTRTSTLNDVTCRLYGKFSGILTHVLARCSGLAQIKYLDAVLKVLFFEMPRKRKLGDTVPPCFTPEADASFYLPVFVDHTFVEPTEFTRALLITGPRKYSCWKWVSFGE